MLTWTLTLCLSATSHISQQLQNRQWLVRRLPNLTHLCLGSCFSRDKQTLRPGERSEILRELRPAKWSVGFSWSLCFFWTTTATVKLLCLSFQWTVCHALFSTQRFCAGSKQNSALSHNCWRVGCSVWTTHSSDKNARLVFHGEKSTDAFARYVRAACHCSLSEDMPQLQNNTDTCGGFKTEAECISAPQGCAGALSRLSTWTYWHCGQKQLTELCSLLLINTPRNVCFPDLQLSFEFSLFSERLVVMCCLRVFLFSIMLFRHGCRIEVKPHPIYADVNAWWLVFFILAVLFHIWWVKNKSTCTVWLG